MLGDHNLRGKFVPWQGSVSAPLICAGPGMQKGAVVERPVSTMDLAATFLDYANIPITTDPKMTSRSLRTRLKTGVDDDYRSFVSSGLQNMPFGTP
jgi:arylsulfatase A-like enzyme